MSNYGLYAKNASGDLIIDSNFENFSYKEKIKVKVSDNDGPYFVPDVGRVGYVKKIHVNYLNLILSIKLFNIYEFYPYDNSSIKFIFIFSIYNLIKFCYINFGFIEVFFT